MKKIHYFIILIIMIIPSFAAAGLLTQRDLEEVFGPGSLVLQVKINKVSHGKEYFEGALGESTHVINWSTYSADVVNVLFGRYEKKSIEFKHQVSSFKSGSGIETKLEQDKQYIVILVDNTIDHSLIMLDRAEKLEILPTVTDLIIKEVVDNSPLIVKARVTHVLNDEEQKEIRIKGTNDKITSVLKPVFDAKITTVLYGECENKEVRCYSFVGYEPPAKTFTLESSLGSNLKQENEYIMFLYKQGDLVWFVRAEEMSTLSSVTNAINSRAEQDDTDLGENDTP